MSDATGSSQPETSGKTQPIPRPSWLQVAGLHLIGIMTIGLPVVLGLIAGDERFLTIFAVSCFVVPLHIWWYVWGLTSKRWSPPAISARTFLLLLLWIGSLVLAALTMGADNRDSDTVWAVQRWGRETALRIYTASWIGALVGFLSVTTSLQAERREARIRQHGDDPLDDRLLDIGRIARGRPVRRD